LKPAVFGELIGKPFISSNVFVGRGTIVEQGAVLKGPAWIGENCHIRSGCYVRENVVVGDGVVMGNSCEFKNCILFDEAKAPHFNYVGDSILGHGAHLGAGVILSNVKLDHGEITVAASDGNVATGLTKFGAIVGDRTEIGCNAVINPGSILGRDCLVYPGVNFRGVLPEGSVVKLRQEIQVLERRDGRET
jgi:NDP-sugar pyrophosphorylase family protein